MGLFSSIGKIFSSVASPLVSGVASIFGGAQQNASAKSLAQTNNDVAITLANTAHQREVADLKAAGLNPILSANGNGAASPAMQSYQPQNIIEPGVSSALRTMQMRESLNNLRADTAQKHQAAELSKAQQSNVEAQTSLVPTQLVKLENDIQNTVADYYLKDAQARVARANETSAKANASIAQMDATAQQEMGLLIKKLGIAGGTGKSLADTLKILHGMSKSK